MSKKRKVIKKFRYTSYSAAKRNAGIAHVKRLKAASRYLCGISSDMNRDNMKSRLKNVIREALKLAIMKYFYDSIKAISRKR